MSNPWYFDYLQIEPTSDQRQIKKAYARLLKTFDPEQEPARFERLRQAFDLATLSTQSSSAFDTDPPSMTVTPIKSVSRTSNRQLDGVEQFIYACQQDLTAACQYLDTQAELDIFLEVLYTQAIPNKMQILGYCHQHLHLNYRQHPWLIPMLEQDQAWQQLPIWQQQSYLETLSTLQNAPSFDPQIIRLFHRLEILFPVWLIVFLTPTVYERIKSDIHNQSLMPLAPSSQDLPEDITQRIVQTLTEEPLDLSRLLINLIKTPYFENLDHQSSLENFLRALIFNADLPNRHYLLQSCIEIFQFDKIQRNTDDPRFSKMIVAFAAFQHLPDAQRNAYLKTINNINLSAQEPEIPNKFSRLNMQFLKKNFDVFLKLSISDHSYQKLNTAISDHQFPPNKPAQTSSFWQLIKFVCVVILIFGLKVLVLTIFSD